MALAYLPFSECSLHLVGGYSQQEIISLYWGYTVWSGGKMISWSWTTRWWDFTGFQGKYTTISTICHYTSLSSSIDGVPPNPLPPSSRYVIEPGSTVSEVDVYSITPLERRTTVAGCSRFVRRGCWENRRVKVSIGSLRLIMWPCLQRPTASACHPSAPTPSLLSPTSSCLIQRCRGSIGKSGGNLSKRIQADWLTVRPLPFPEPCTLNLYLPLSRK